MTDEHDITALRKQVAKGAGWIVAARFAIRILGFVNTIIVARLLAPDDFGIVAIGVTTMQLLQGFSDVGVSQAVIRFRDANKDDVDTLFTLSAIRGVIVAAFLIIIAPLAADFYDDQRVLAVFLGVSLFPLATGFINPRFFEFERDLDFSKDFWITTINKLAGVIVSITIAVIFRTYWAIILGLVTGGFVQLALSYVMRPYLPRFTFASFNKVFAFSGWVAGVSFMAALNNKLDSLIVARFAGTSDAGNYYMGIQLSELPTTELATPIARAIYPGFSTLQEKTEQMRRAFLQGVEALSAIALPAAFGFAFLAGDLVQLLLGDKWADAAPVIAIIAPVMGLQTLFLATQFYAMARDMTKFVFYREFFFFFVRAPLLVWATIEHGLMGAAWACAAMGLLHATLNLALYSRVSGHSFLEPLWAARRSLFAALAMALYFQLLRPELGWIEGLTLPVQIMLDVIAGAGVFIGAAFLIWRLEGKPEGVEQSVAGMINARLNKSPNDS